MFDFLSRGDLQVIPERLQYAQGESIKGRVTLKLNKPTQANGLSIELFAQRREYRYDPKLRQQHQNVVTVFDFKLPIAGAQEYSEGEFPFEVKIPVANAGQPAGEPSGLAGTIAEIAAVVGEMRPTIAPLEWFVQAQLDIPGAIDMRKRVQINVT